MENQQKKIFANCSQTVRNHCEFRNVLATQFRIAKSNTPVHCSFAKFASHKAYAKFRIAKIRNEFANQFRNAKFAMRISQCQFRNAKFNFAMPISNSQCQYTIHLSHNQSHCEISHCEIHKPLCENSQTHFALPNPVPLRNSHLQALSSSVINATDFQTW